MFIFLQILACVLAAVIFVLLLRTNRRNDAQSDIYLLSLLLCAMGLCIPDAFVLFLPIWWALFILRASSLRAYMASILSILTVVLYGTIVWQAWPNAAAVQIVADSLVGIVSREFFFNVYPQWISILTVLLALLGLWAFAAHMSHYSRANVRVQTRVLLVAPVFFISLLSFSFPPTSGLSLIALLWLTAIYLVGYYLITYATFRINFSSFRRGEKRRLSRRADGRNPYLRKRPAAPKQRAFSRRSRRR